MALYEMSGENTLAPIPLTSFSSMGVYERTHLQKGLRAQISAITPGVETMVLAEEFGDWVGANRRIDLLCLDKDRKLVVVELKREDGASMELQAIRYAAMISAMRFEQAVEAHRKYLASIGSTNDAERATRDFLELDDGERVELHEEVRIVLAAASFGTELSTTVLWLNKQGLDLRCVQMRPHLLDGRLLLDVQQVIPLPEAAQYQVAIRAKEAQQAVARSSERNMTKYNLSIDGRTFASLAGRRVIYEVIAEALRQGITIDAISGALPWKGESVFLSALGVCAAEVLSPDFCARRSQWPRSLRGLSDGKTSKCGSRYCWALQSAPHWVQAVFFSSYPTKTAIRRKFSAMHTSLNSARTRCSPRMLNCLNPSTFLIQPLGGSAIHLRLL